MTSNVDRGYFLLADISGFTSFVADSELDHAQGIVEQVLNTIVGKLTPTMTLCEIEGDAVYVYQSASRISRGELIAELVEVTYMAFRDQQTKMLRNATCPCSACRSIGKLDLKFVIHFGDFALREVAGKSKPLGSSVNLAHRLLKNRIVESTGWQGYALFSQAALDQMQLSPDGLHALEEDYEDLGTVTTYSSDLRQFYDDAISLRRVVLTQDDSHAEFVYEFEMPPAIVWDWLNDTSKRSTWMQQSNWKPTVRANGRTGARAKNHCSSFKVLEEVLDWRPFDYYTVRLVSGPLRVLATISLEEQLGGTRVRWKVKIENRLPRWVGKALGKVLILRRLRLPQGFDSMSQLMKHAHS